MVPKAMCPALAASRAPGTRSKIHAILVAEKYGSRSSPVLRLSSASASARVQFAAAIRRATVLPYDGVVERHAAAPIPQHRRLALIGDADRGDGSALFRANAARLCRLADSTVAQITSASCSTHPGAG